MVLSGAGPYFLQATLAATGSEVGSLFGARVAISGDGGTIAASGRSPSPGAAGAVVMTFDRSGAEWVQVSTLPDPESSDRYVAGLVISEDGGTMAVAWWGAQAPNFTTSVSVYERSGVGWTATANLSLPTIGTLTELALSSDGSVLAVGAPAGLTGDGPSGSGFVQVYAETGSGWAPTARLVGPAAVAQDRFGISVALSGDGGTLAVGAVPPAPGEPSRAGVMYVFEDEGAGWVVSSEIASPAYYGFGTTAAISEDGSRLLVQGFDQEEDPDSLQGVVFAYARDGGTWGLEARFDGGPGRESFGDALALDADGSTAVVGEPWAEVQDGAMFVYERSGSSWSRVQAVAGGHNTALGETVAIGGRTIVAGAPFGGSGSASVYYAPDGFEIVAEPVDQAGHPFAAVTFAAEAGGAETIATQWQSSGDGGQTWADVPGATGQRLSFTPAPADSGKLFRAVFTDGQGTTLISRAASLTVSPATSVVTISAASNRFNEEATFTIVVSAAGTTGPAPVGGSVEFDIGSFRTTAAVVDGVATVRVPAFVMRPGVFVATADYSGDDPVMGAGQASVQHSVLRGVASIRLSVDPAAPYYGQAIHVVAAIDYGPVPSDEYRPTGHVRFTDPGRDLGLGPVVAAGGDVTAAIEASFFGLAGNVVNARYLGDDLYEPSAIFTTTFDQTAASTVIVGTASPTTFGEPVRFRAKVGSGSTAPMTGTIVATLLDSFGGRFRYERPVGPDGVADFLFEEMRAGRLYVTLDYSDAEGRYLPSRDFETVEIAGAPTSVVMSSSTELAAPGSLIRFTAFVASRVSGEPVGSGRVTFIANGVVLDTVPIYASGEASLWTRQLADVGSYEIIGVYDGAEDYLGSRSAEFIQYVGPSPALLRPQTSTTLTTSASTSNAGDEVSFTAIVASPNGGPTSGVVDFSIGGVVVASAAVQPDGRATLTTSALVSGVYTVSASFRGDGYYQASDPSTLTQTVLPGAPTPTTTDTWLESSANPSPVGAPLILTASVWAPDGGPRPSSGVVRFYVGLQPEREVPVDAQGRATLEIFSFIPGDYVITAVFLGAEGHQPSQSQHLTQSILPRPSDSGATTVEVPATSTGPGTEPGPGPGPESPAVPAPTLSRREQALARVRARREALVAARAERLAKLSRRRPPVARMR